MNSFVGFSQYFFCAQTWLGKLAAIEYVGQNRNFCGTVNVLQNAISFFLKEVQILIHECKEMLERIAFYLLNRYGTVCTEGLCLTQDYLKPSSFETLRTHVYSKRFKIS